MFLPHIFKRQEAQFQPNGETTAGDLHRQKRTIKIDAAVMVVLDQWLMFSDDTAVFEWALPIVQTKWAQAEFAPHASLEAIVGHKGARDQTRINMVELLHIMLHKAGMEPHDYRCTFFEVTGQQTGLRIWCATAQRRGPDDFDA